MTLDTLRGASAPLDPRWDERAKCADADPDLFFNSEREADAIAFCNTCVVRPECLVHAMSNPNTVGVWGGTTEKRRDQLRATRRRRIA